MSGITVKNTAQLVSIRAALFIGLTVLSLLLAFPVGTAILLPLQRLISPWPDDEFWHLVDDLVFDLPVKWPYLVFAPGIPLAVALWAVVAIGYGWLTRRVRVLYSGLGVLPTVWVIGVGLVLMNGT